MALRFHELRVSGVVDETADCRSFELSVPRELEDAFRYEAGQHLMLELPIAGEKLRRCYSLSSCPDLGEPMRIAVKRIEGGRASNWMNDQLSVGDLIMSSVPEGRFVLDHETRSGLPLFLFAAGSGITPILSLLQSALVRTKRPVTLTYANRDEGSIIYGASLDRLAAKHPERLKIHHHLDSEGGLVTKDSIRALLHHTDISEFYLCGPEPFMELVESTLAEAGVYEGLVHIERFASPGDARGAPVDETAFDAPATFSLWLDGRSRTVPYAAGKTLLECADAAGLAPARSCESGFCGSCMAYVKLGDVHMRTHEALSERDVSRGLALLCQSVPASAEPIEIDCDSTSFRAASAVKSSYGKAASRVAAVVMFALMLVGTLVLRLVP